MRSLFLKEEVKNNNTKKSFVTIFKRIDEFEKTIEKSIDDWDKDDILDFLAIEGSMKLNTLSVKWSLLKKYLEYINNNSYLEISKEDLNNLEHKSLEYISLEEVQESVEPLKNNIDKAIILLLRYGIKGKGFEELINLETINIEGNTIRLKNRVVVLDDYTAEIVNKAKNERGYHMHIKEGKKSNFIYYHYNMESKYLWKNRKNKYNHDGLDAMKETACKDKLSRLYKIVGNEKLDTINMVISYVTDKVIEFENLSGITLTEVQVRDFIDKLGVGANYYAVFNMKSKLRG